MKVTDEKSIAQVHEVYEELIAVEEHNDIEKDFRKLCGAGEHSISINPYGEVFPCNLLQLKIGDINQESIDDIWNKSDKLIWWRKNNFRDNRQGCEKCEHADECIFCPGEAMMREGTPLAKYEAACNATLYAINRKQSERRGN